MNHKLLIIHSEKPTQADLALSKLAYFLGVESEFIGIEQIAENMQSLKSRNLRLALNGGTLVCLYEKGVLHLVRAILDERKTSLFVYGVFSSIEFEKALAELTDGHLHEAVPFTADRGMQVQLAANYTHILGEMSGLSFPLPRAIVGHSWLLQDNRSGSCVIMAIGQNPVFLLLKQSGSEIFFVSNEAIQDIDDEIYGEPDLKNHFVGLFPALIFLRHAFRGYCWEGVHKHACLTIDDPLVRRKYGYIDFKSLLSVMENHNFTSSIGFIPWNYQRSKKAGIDLIKSSRGRLSLCVHGSDHMKGEFASNDYGLLNGKLKTALRRMVVHRELTGLSFDKVMIFPQGIFSEPAMEALKQNNYLAAVNYEVVPYKAANSQPLRNFLQPAVMQYSCFPLFVRRDPEQIADLAIDAYLGRPVLVMTHQESFKDNYALIVDTVEKIKSMHPAMEWLGLADICGRTYQKKMECDGSVSIKIFSTKTTISDTFKKNKRVNIIKEEADPGSIEEISVNNIVVQHKFSNGTVFFDAEIGNGKTANVHIRYKDCHDGIIGKPGMAESTSVYLRRYLCEMRDYGVSRGHTFLSRIRIG